ncbi:MAG: ABC transporter ATP-binding protein [Bacilli bacterium]
MKRVVDELALAQDKYLASFESFNRGEFKEYVATLTNINTDVDDPLSEEKDDLAFTFQASLRAALKKLSIAEADLANGERVKAEIAEKQAKGIDTSKIELKIRSFGSEIVLTPTDVFSQICELFREFIADLNDILANREVLDADRKSADVLALLAQKQADSRFRLPNADAKKKAIEILEEVGIPSADKRFRQYPFELSGGMRQRIVIAIALLANPDILICDEPTTALDVTIQAQILDLINKIKAERNLSIIFITHNLGVVANMADDIAVMYAGKIVEFGGVNDVFYNSKHPYTWALLSSMPDLSKRERLEAIPGTPPNMIIPPKGDAFAPRNKYALLLDYEQEPPFFQVSENHYAATWLLHPNAPEAIPPKIVQQRIADLREYQKTLNKKDGGLNDAK